MRRVPARTSLPVETVMPTPSDNASAAAELAALVDAVDACRSRLSALAERRNAALRGDNDDADSLLVSIYEAERGLSTAVRLLQRAVRSAR
ncbi:MAG: hypothetical protein RL072_1071 [Actinomycetota bacterium]